MLTGRSSVIVSLTYIMWDIWNKLNDYYYYSFFINVIVLEMNVRIKIIVKEMYRL